MKIGVAIPCYKGHINKLYELLESIENQTRIPDKVVVSCSSTNTETIPFFKKYIFFLKFIPTMEKKNAAENRNIAAFYLKDMDYISFFDADDIMIPLRLEFIEKVMEKENPDIILHNFYLKNKDEQENSNKNENIDTLVYKINSLRQCFSGCITHKEYSPNSNIHHSQVTIKSNLFDKVKFPEEMEVNTREDCGFCYRIFDLPNITNAYIQNKLSIYLPSKTFGHLVL
jgi:hypothetical protein